MRTRLIKQTVFITATLSLAACVNTDDTSSQTYNIQNKDAQQQCLAQNETMQQSTVPLYYDKRDEPVYRELPSIETFQCLVMPEPSPSIKELNERKPVSN
jgi:hypothetical protein